MFSSSPGLYPLEARVQPPPECPLGRKSPPAENLWPRLFLLKPSNWERRSPGKGMCKLGSGSILLCDLGKTAPPLWASSASQLEVWEDQQGHSLERRNHASTPRLLRKPQQRTGIWGGPSLGDIISSPGS